MMYYSCTILSSFSSSVVFWLWVYHRKMLIKSELHKRLLSSLCFITAFIAFSLFMMMKSYATLLWQLISIGDTWDTCYQWDSCMKDFLSHNIFIKVIVKEITFLWFHLFKVFVNDRDQKLSVIIIAVFWPPTPK